MLRRDRSGLYLGTYFLLMYGRVGIILAVKCIPNFQQVDVSDSLVLLVGFFLVRRVHIVGYRGSRTAAEGENWNSVQAWSKTCISSKNKALLLSSKQIV